MQSNIYRLFIYGSLRSGFHNTVYSYISRYFILDGLGSVQAKLFDLGDYPGAVPCTEDHFITGELYHIAQHEEFESAIKYLDDYEGLFVSAGETPLFRREPAHVLFQNTTVIAWMYWYNLPITNQPHIESGDYIAYKMGIGK